MKTIHYKILFAIIMFYIVGTVYYTLLLYNFSWFGIFVSFTLTFMPYVCGIYAKHSIDKIIKNGNN
jgi:hypothetical protein